MADDYKSTAETPFQSCDDKSCGPLIDWLVRSSPPFSDSTRRKVYHARTRCSPAANQLQIRNSAVGVAPANLMFRNHLAVPRRVIFTNQPLFLCAIRQVCRNWQESREVKYDDSILRQTLSSAHSSKRYVSASSEGHREERRPSDVVTKRKLT